MEHEAIYATLKDGIAGLDEAKVVRAAQTVLDEKIDVMTSIDRGLSAGMKIIGERFENGEAFLPELIMGAELFDKAMAMLEQELAKAGQTQAKAGRVVLGTVKGDIHKIGKDILTVLMKVRGFEVLNLGEDIAMSAFFKRAREFDADIICMSSLLTTTMPAQKEVIDFLNEKGVREEFVVMVGGGPVNQEWADEIGADGYAETAEEGTRLAFTLMQKRVGQAA